MLSPIWYQAVYFFRRAVDPPYDRLHCVGGSLDAMVCTLRAANGNDEAGIRAVLQACVHGFQSGLSH